ncbi:hypothetical protein [Allocoleopsis sp.]
MTKLVAVTLFKVARVLKLEPPLNPSWSIWTVSINKPLTTIQRMKAL